MATRSLVPVLVSSFLLPFLWASCKSDKPAASVEANVVGRWELTSAQRNQKPTETLAGTFFEFGADGAMTTNLPIGAENPTPYEVTSEGIVQKSTPPVTYAIQAATDSTLTLTAQLRGIPFILQFHRAEPPVDTLMRDSM
jgi:hypothetical protein